MDFPEKIKVNEHEIEITPRYNETDQGGVVHHSIYPVYFEMGRTELLRTNGLAYKNLEKAGVYFVVAELNIKFRRPCFYDEKLKLKTSCSNVTASKVEHEYELKKADEGIMVAEGKSILACISKEGGVRRIPGFMYPVE